MAEPESRSLVSDLDAILRALAQLYGMKSKRLEVEILASSKVTTEAEFDSLDGGTYFYTLNLGLPVSLYSTIEESVEQYQEDIRKSLQPLTAGYPGERISRVVLSVKLEHDEKWRASALKWVHRKLPPPPPPSKAEAEREFDFFISHATEDKQSLVRPLAENLQASGAQVWYDEFTLTIGDSLRRSIDKGLARSRFGIVVLSPAFFGKEWPQYELDGLIARDIGGVKVVLPVWHQVTRQDVLRFSPSLADRLAFSTANMSVEEMAKQFVDLLGNWRRKSVDSGRS